MSDIVVQTRDDIRVKVKKLNDNETVCIDIGQSIYYTVQYKDITLRNAKYLDVKERMFSISADSLYLYLSESDLKKVSALLDIEITIFDE